MRHGSLFSGIGGFDLAAEWMGWENVFQVEIDPYCQKVLTKNFPNVERYGDIKEFKGQADSVDVLSGGFPCQPFSHAGQRKGESDDRYLWPEYLRIIREIQPSYVVGENVAGLISMEDGETLERIFIDLEGEGYQVESFIIPACSVGAWHRRDRVWIIGHARSKRASRNNTRKSPGIGMDLEQYALDKKRRNQSEYKLNPSSKDVPNTNSEGLPVGARRGVGGIRGEKETPQGSKPGRAITKGGDYWATEPSVGRVANGVSSTLDETLRDYGYANNKEAFAEIDQFRKSIMRDMWDEGKKTKSTPHGTEGGQGNDFMQPMSYGYSHERWKLGCRIKEDAELRSMWNWFYTKPLEETQDLQQKMLGRIREIERAEKVASSRVDRLKGLGNAIVPQVAFELFKAIEILYHENQ